MNTILPSTPGFKSRRWCHLCGGWVCCSFGLLAPWGLSLSTPVFHCLIKLQFLNVDSIWNMYGRRKATFWICYPKSRLKIVLKVPQGWRNKANKWVLFSLPSACCFPRSLQMFSRALRISLAPLSLRKIRECLQSKLRAASDTLWNL